MAKQRSNKSGGYIVAQPFKDSREYIQNGEVNSYEVGVDVSHLDPARLEKLVARGIVTKGEAKESETEE